jgi:hypothetical protein
MRQIRWPQRRPTCITKVRSTRPTYLCARTRLHVVRIVQTKWLSSVILTFIWRQRGHGCRRVANCGLASTASCCTPYAYMLNGGRSEHAVPTYLGHVQRLHVNVTQITSAMPLAWAHGDVAVVVDWLTTPVAHWLATNTHHMITAVQCGVRLAYTAFHNTRLFSPRVHRTLDTVEIVSVSQPTTTRPYVDAARFDAGSGCPNLVVLVSSRPALARVDSDAHRVSRIVRPVLVYKCTPVFTQPDDIRRDTVDSSCTNSWDTQSVRHVVRRPRCQPHCTWDSTLCVKWVCVLCNNVRSYRHHS